MPVNYRSSHCTQKPVVATLVLLAAALLAALAFSGALAPAVYADAPVVTTTTLTVSPNPAVLGETLTLTATVAAGPDEPTGVVTFTIGGVTVTQPVSASVEVYVTDTLPAGRYTLAAAYGGDNDHAPSVSETQVQAIFARPAVSMGGSSSCIVSADGALSCWGTNGRGQMDAPTSGDWVQIERGNFFGCALDHNGAIACWGQINAAPPGGVWTQVEAGWYHACAVNHVGAAACWGQDLYGETQPPAGAWRELSAGGLHTCGIRTNGALACWGYNSNGQTTPPAGQFASVASGYDFNCGVRTDGTLACWGNTGDGRTTPPAGQWRQVSAGDMHACGIRTDGTLACWGNNSSGQLAAPTGNQWVQVSALFNSTCATRADGAFSCWGDNTYGQAPRISLAPATLPDARINVAYDQQLAVAPSASLQTPFTFRVSAGALPAGLSLSTTGRLSGTPTAGGSAAFTIETMDAQRIVGTQTYTLNVKLYQIYLPWVSQ